MIIPETFIKPEAFNYFRYNSSSRSFDWVGYDTAEYIIDWYSFSDDKNFTNYFPYCIYYLEPSLLKIEKNK